MKRTAELVSAAKDAQAHAYVPYSHFRVGAALLTASGEIISGCNIENASYGLTNCAERTAFFKAISEGKTEFTHLVVIGDTADAISPCGACRQVMVEHCAPEMPVTLCNQSGDVKEMTVAELMPYSFTSTETVDPQA